MGLDRRYTKPMLDHSSKPLGVGAMTEEVHHCLLGLLAKRAKTIVVPTSFLKMIHHPNTNLDS
jgi:hypothetical protein